MPQVDVAASEEIVEGKAMQFAVADERIMVCRVEGVLHALHAICPHRGAFLTQGSIQGNVILCPWHAWGFDVTTGEGITNPMSCVKTFDVREEDGRVKIDVG